MYLDVRCPPNRLPIDVERELRQVVAGISKEHLQQPAEVEFYVSRPGTILDDRSPIVEVICDAHREVSGVVARGEIRAAILH